jgi:hypothetical protein
MGGRSNWSGAPSAGAWHLEWPAMLLQGMSATVSDSPAPSANGMRPFAYLQLEWAWLCSLHSQPESITPSQSALTLGA